MRVSGKKTKVVILGAAGRDFHNFNVCFRNNPKIEVICFTATQIPNIEGRRYPKELAGKFYPKGIPIFPESELENIIRKRRVELVIFSYSDVSHEYVMHRASLALSCGAGFQLLSPKETMLKSERPVIAVCATRTGSGKSQTTRKICEILREWGKKVVVVRHPMAYGNLRQGIVQRFATYSDLEKFNCTIEEREEFEPHIDRGVVVYAGVDYEVVLREVEKEAEVIVWDGGNNDLPFFKPSLQIVVTDPHRAGHEVRYHPGETNLRMADIVVINKVDTAKKEDVEKVKENVRSVNSKCILIEAESPISIEKPEVILGKRVLVVEDGPTLTHGEMKYGAGVVAAKTFGALEVVDPRPYVKGSILETFREYPFIGNLLPAMGYGKEQILDLERTINSTPCDIVVIGTPVDLRRLVKINKPALRVKYELKENGKIDLRKVLLDSGILGRKRK